MIYIHRYIYHMIQHKNSKDVVLNIDDKPDDVNVANKKNVKMKISDSEFIVPRICEYSNLVNINYNIQQLKQISKEYKIKVTGKKDELIQQIYNHMRCAKSCIFIQKIFRKILVKNYMALHGPGFYNRGRCTNDCDFVTLDDISMIPYTQFFSFEDDDKFIYVFDILSIYNLYIKNTTQVHNPFSTKLIDPKVHHNMMNYIKYSKILGIKINIDYDTLKHMDDTKKLEMSILNLFQKMDSLGNYTDMTWFTGLNRSQLIKLLRELHDIWHYRANLSQVTKREICPPYGNPFISININTIHTNSFLIIKKSLVTIIDEFINKGIDNNSKTLGCYYVLACLTLVSYSAAESLPWLYEAVHY
jgi:hypothetical protein